MLAYYFNAGGVIQTFKNQCAPQLNYINEKTGNSRLHNMEIGMDNLLELFNSH